MENHQLRSILLNVHYRLSDNDRERLHFYLKNDVPRPVGDDSTLQGTFKLMQSLIDEEKITEKDFTLLIDAFQQIRCSDAVNLLREHQRQMQSSGCNEPTQSVAPMMPSVLQDFLTDDEEDKGPTNNFTLRQINNNNHVIDSNNINISGDTESLLSSRKRMSRTPSFTKKCIFLPVILFLLTLALLIVIVIQGMNHIHSLEAYLQIKQNLITKTRDQNNQTVRQATNLLLEKNAVIEELNKTLIKLENERKTVLIKAGRIYGGDNGENFDDSLLSMFTSAHYLSGIIISRFNWFHSCQFIYRSPHDNQSRIESKLHGNDRVKFDSIQEYYLDDDERIEEVSVKLCYEDTCQVNKSLVIVTPKVIGGWKFVTTKGRIIPSFVRLRGDDVESERFSGYTVGYASGKAAARIDQLQFFWYRTKDGG